MQCPTCGGDGVPLGTLGKLDHFRCRHCGMQFNVPNEDEPEEEPGRPTMSIPVQYFKGSKWDE